MSAFDSSHFQQIFVEWVSKDLSVYGKERHNQTGTTGGPMGETIQMKCKGWRILPEKYTPERRSGVLEDSEVGRV